MFPGAIDSTPARFPSALSSSAIHAPGLTNVRRGIKYLNDRFNRIARSILIKTSFSDVEIHYTCSPKASDMTRRPPLPPWYLQPVQKPLEGNQDTWLPNSAIQKERDIAPVLNEPSGKKNFNSRIPILVATTTQPPKRIPITTPRPTTPSTTTATPETTTTLALLTSEEIQPTFESSQLAVDKYGKAFVLKVPIQYSKFSRKLLKVIYLFKINKNFPQISMLSGKAL